MIKKLIERERERERERVRNKKVMVNEYAMHGLDVHQAE